LGVLDLLSRTPLAVAARRSRNEIRSDAQSLGFHTDVCVVLREELETDHEVRLTLLDVGARTATGSNLMAQVFHPKSYSQIKITVTALDIDETHRDEALRRFPDIRYQVADVRDVKDQYDIVTCSHTLEHVVDPGPVLEHLRRIAKRLVVIAAPYRESLGEGIPNPSNHQFSFDDEFFARYEPHRMIVYRSPHWSSGDCFLAVYRLDA
jgi:2-polyprenyl-3-methyl-5-hydroxy-6-metoxy-1,4-benzoquinol methylase